MSGAAAALAVLLAAAPARGGGGVALPVGTARYAMLLGGEPVGVVELALRCEGPACTAAWESRQRLPEEAGGGVHARRIEVEVDRAGRALGPARVQGPEGARETAMPRGLVPVMLAEVALAAATPGMSVPGMSVPGTPEAGSACVDVADERSGGALRACGVRRNGWLDVTVGRERERVRSQPGQFPGEIELPSQGVRFVLDARADLPAAPPRLFGVRVAGPEDLREAEAFCGVPIDPPPRPGAADGLPAPAASGPTCREKTAAWLARARSAGVRGRTAVGVAFDGGAWVWHAWAEAHVGGRWVPVDPSFHQAPARGPRFTLATWEDGDEAARAEAGRRILQCWGRARVLTDPG